MTLHRIYTHNPTTNISMNTPLFSHMLSHKNKNKKREKVTILEILNFIYKMPWCQSVTGFIAVFYPNFNVTRCDKKCNFLHIYTSNILLKVNLSHLLENRRNIIFVLLVHTSELSVIEIW